MLFRTSAKPPELRKRTAIYISDKYRHIVIAPQWQNEPGIIYEQDSCSTMTIPADAAELGKLAIENFDLYEVKDKNLRNHQGGERPAFRHSKSASVAAF